MLFTSYTFIFFILAVFVIYYIIPKKFQWPFLLIASYVFYAFSGWKFVIFLLFTSLTAHAATMKIQSLHTERKEYVKAHKSELSRDEKKAYNAKMKGKARLCMILCLVANFLLLGVIKYTNFVIDNINHIISGEISFVNIALPMGLSFYMFQTMGYVIDVFWEKTEAEMNPFKVMLFTSFFPQLVQGPISRYGDLSETLFSEHKFDWAVITSGCERILWGFFKKMVIADRMLPAVKTIIGDPDTYNGAFVLLGMLFYAIELYSDFTGGIDITIGVAEVLGIKVKENFERPFFSKTIDEYWRRWHITMGTWFRDYIFYPISVSPKNIKRVATWKKIFGDHIGKRMPIYIGTTLTWFVTGVWHGASWNFIVWGLLNGLIIMISEELKPLYERFHSKFNVSGKWPYEFFCIARTFVLMSFLRSLDCYRDVPLTFKMVGTIFTSFGGGRLFDGSLFNLGITAWDYAVIAVGIVLMNIVSIYNEKHKEEGTIRVLINKSAFSRILVIWTLFFAIIIFGAYGIGFDASQFIYNQF
ncbi:MAG: MBOAT family protein [Lachnospiraceae bacterium]|nr:MBOAT family protein [Lachnospiraceae bacterium]